MSRRVPKVLTSYMQVYLRKPNKKYAQTTGKKLFGSHSAYIDALISKDRGIEPALGVWKAKGEAKENRKKFTKIEPIKEIAQEIGKKILNGEIEVEKPSAYSDEDFENVD